eukprot:TRINITY_DN5994_c0_g1_i1.p1 TRINITY_DN5994_c0_g1~~TRINITY_DN5994_c0_g1_i1.p1  ORF type:complete len:400 (+),score=91.75 TRINITY_DN5994_c0_g1_i1:151-1350(+)
MAQWSWLTEKGNLIKEITLTALLISTFLVSFLPRFLSTRMTENSLFSILNCLAGGVVLGAALSHMLPNATNSFRVYLDDSPEKVKDYPFSFLFAALSLMVLITVDKIFIGDHHQHDAPNFQITSETVVVEVDPHGSQKIIKSETTRLIEDSHCHTYEERQRDHKHKHHKEKEGHSHSHSHKDKNGAQAHDGYVQIETPKEKVHCNGISLDGANCTREFIHEVHTDNDHEHVIREEHHHHHHEHDEEKERRARLLQAYIFLLAVSFHSIFEGLGMGSEGTEEGIVSVLIAVVSHKWLEAFALGCSLHFAQFTNMTLAILLFVYSWTTPLGIIIGMAVENLVGKGTELASAILVSIAAGSFLYIALIEILPNELGKPKHRFLKLTLAWVGWAGMALVAYWA